jgi:ferritin-like metal-binding protein YciE
LADDHIATYLSDHLAGAVVAVELMENLEAVYAGKSIADFIANLRTDIEADVRELENLLGRLHISESRTRKASAWLTEKFTQLKLRLDDAAHGDLRLFESLEALSLGIEGKRSLWLALSAAAEVSPQLRIADYQRLRQRAEEQRERVEAKRLEVAQTALKSERSTQAKSSSSE